jgi:hypothetical protein
VGTLVVVVLAAIVIALASGGGKTEAHSPHPGLDFSIGIDTNGDNSDNCGTKPAQPTNCYLPAGSTFTLSVYLNSLGGVPGYKGFDIGVYYTGVSSKYLLDANPWPDCVFEAFGPHPGVPADAEGWGCAIGVPPAQPSTYTGRIGTAVFNCTNDGTITLRHHDGVTPPLLPSHSAYTRIVEDVFSSGDGVVLLAHAEGQDTTETLTIHCSVPVGGLSYDSTAGQGATSGINGGLLAAAIAATAAGVFGAVGWCFRRRTAR